MRQRTRLETNKGKSDSRNFKTKDEKKPRQDFRTGGALVALQYTLINKVREL